MGGSPRRFSVLHAPDAPVRFFALALLLPLLAACDEPPPPVLSPADKAERDSVLALLRTTDTDALAAAFERLADLPYRVETTTAQLALDGEIVAHRRFVAVVDPAAPPPDVLETDSTGAFDWGALGALASDDAEALLPTDNPATLVFPDDPPYLDPQGREAFAFRFAPDTLIGGRRVQVLTVDARPGEGDDQLLRHARLYVADGGQLVGARLRRRTESVLFTEKSEATILLHPTSAGTWLPHATRYDATVGALFTDRRRFRLTRLYTPLAPALSAAAPSVAP